MNLWIRDFLCELTYVLLEICNLYDDNKILNENGFVEFLLLYIVFSRIIWYLDYLKKEQDMKLIIYDSKNLINEGFISKTVI